jgi:NAD-dependent deacetylase sirtuin 4
MNSSIRIIQKLTKNSLLLRLYSRIHISSYLNTAESLKYVPKSQPISKEDLEKLNEFIFKSKRLFIISGAGLSTESGIPDYRSEGVGLYATSKNRPVQYNEFLKSEQMRTRYWARNYIGSFQ